MSNRLATLYDVCKGRKYSKGNKLFLKVSGLAEAGVPQRQRESKGQRKKTQNTSAGLFTADLSALTRVRRCPCGIRRDEASSRIAEPDTKECQSVKVSKCQSAKVSKCQSATNLDIEFIIKRGSRLFCHPTDTYQFIV